MTDQKNTFEEVPRSRLRDEFEIFLTFADDGDGGDTTHNGEPLPSFEEWLDR